MLQVREEIVVVIMIWILTRFVDYQTHKNTQIDVQSAGIQQVFRLAQLTILKRMSAVQKVCTIA